MRQLSKQQLPVLLKATQLLLEQRGIVGVLGVQQCRGQHTQQARVEDFDSIDASYNRPANQQQNLYIPEQKSLPLTGPLSDYWDARRQGLYRDDKLQETAAQLLHNLFEELTERQPLQPVQQQREMPNTWWGGLGALFGQNGSVQDELNEVQGPLTKGIYMFGGVGTGKTMLMDMFARGLIGSGTQKVKRMHFHDFMIDVHKKLKTYQGQKDPLCMVANEILRDCTVLCLDEFFVTDVADAMILNRLFTKLWFGGLVLVCTSNRHPDSLYEGGLQRDQFMPFIIQLKEHCVIHDMASSIDHRKLAQQQKGSFFTGPEAEHNLHQKFSLVTNHQPLTPKSVEVVMGRKLNVPKSAGSACFFDFSELCDQPLSAADFIALADNYHTVAISNIPVFKPRNRTSAYRFVSLIDVMYERRIRLICSAEGDHFELFQNVKTAKEWGGVGERQNGDGGDQLLVDNNLGFAKDRTVSRLGEMQSIEYAIEHAEQHEPELLLALREAQQNMEAEGATLQ